MKMMLSAVALLLLGAAPAFAGRDWDDWRHWRRAYWYGPYPTGLVAVYPPYGLYYRGYLPYGEIYPYARVYRGHDEEVFWDGRCKVEREWHHGRLKEEVDCDDD